MADKVLMHHKGLGATFLAPAGAVKHYEERGWKVGELPAKKTSKKSTEEESQDS